jgi:hypothetical protein
MTSRNAPLSLTGKAIALCGSVVVCLSLTQPFAAGSDSSFWHEARGAKYFVLGAEALTLVLVFASLFAVAGLLLLGSALLEASVLGAYTFFTLEFIGLGRAWTLGIVGSAIALVGVSVALVPIMAARTSLPDDAVAFLTPAEVTPAQRPVPSLQHAATDSPEAGWYADPVGEDRLRYWDGHDWSDQTR